MLAGDQVNTGDFEAAFENYAHVVTVNPVTHEALYNWGDDHGTLAQMKLDEVLFREAFAEYEAAIKIKPDKHEALRV